MVPDSSLPDPGRSEKNDNPRIMTRYRIPGPIREYWGPGANFYFGAPIFSKNGGGGVKKIFPVIKRDQKNFPDKHQLN